MRFSYKRGFKGLAYLGLWTGLASAASGLVIGTLYLVDQFPLSCLGVEIGIVCTIVFCFCGSNWFYAREGIK